MPCAAPCNWVPCSRRCDKFLACGHQCPSLCGEICPELTYCQQCGSDEIKSTCVDFLEMKEYREIDLNEDPCIFPDCGHFLTVSSMDGQMDMAQYYELDIDGLPTRICGASQPFSQSDAGVRVCATCRGSLRRISRYGRIVRRAMLDEATKKFITWSREKYLLIAENLVQEQEKLIKTSSEKVPWLAHKAGPLTLPGSRIRQIKFLQELTGNQRYNSIVNLRRKINSYAAQVRKEEQPFQRVADLVMHANRRGKTTQEFWYDESIIQVKSYLLATVLLLKCDITVLSDFLQVWKESGDTKVDVKLDVERLLRDCGDVLQLAQRTMHPSEEPIYMLLGAKQPWTTSRKPAN
ncbi:hypothetical protein CDD82_6187 [Ophiocordyceps australis]|uniref:Uncharacterized protein n=1 Tax=Ophiocordyceps australis TaxID=1399860 RepID=A0A2C5YTG0_9HYPO|nr:hypothetical protein CDD82_6187 [Ophiocordyceps australis]